MPLKLIRGDITELKCDAIVNAANSTLLGGGGVDGAIHRAAGRELLAECITLGGCPAGEAKITKGYRLPSRYVIHTVGPVWNGGTNGEEELLRSCYRNSLALAVENGCESVAFPLISAGVYRYPKDQALKIAVEEIADFLRGNELLVYMVIYNKSDFKINAKRIDDIAAFIGDNYVDVRAGLKSTDRAAAESEELCSEESEPRGPAAFAGMARAFPSTAPQRKTGVFSKAKKLSLNDALNQIDESFSEMLLRKIDEKGMTDIECYKKANIDRKLFSKIRGDRSYRPSKTTAIAFAIALELPLEETKEMLMKAGYALSRSNKFDIIIEYFITEKNYDIFEINEALFEFDQSLLGA